MGGRLTGARSKTITQSVRLYHDHLLVKEPGTRQRTAWHPDLEGLAQELAAGAPMDHALFPKLIG